MSLPNSEGLEFGEKRPTRSSHVDAEIAKSSQLSPERVFENKCLPVTHKKRKFGVVARDGLRSLDGLICVTQERNKTIFILLKAFVCSASSSVKDARA